MTNSKLSRRRAFALLAGAFVIAIVPAEAAKKKRARDIPAPIYQRPRRSRDYGDPPTPSPTPSPVAAPPYSPPHPALIPAVGAGLLGSFGLLSAWVLRR